MKTFTRKEKAAITLVAVLQRAKAVAELRRGTKRK